MNCDGMPMKMFLSPYYSSDADHLIVGDHSGLSQQPATSTINHSHLTPDQRLAGCPLIFLGSIDCASVLALFVRLVEGKSLTRTTHRS